MLHSFPSGSVVKNPPAMQETRVQTLVWEEPICSRATGLAQHNYWACAESGSPNYWARVPQLLSPRDVTTEAHVPRACALQQGPPQWEACASQPERSPARRN